MGHLQNVINWDGDVQEARVLLDNLLLPLAQSLKILRRTESIALAASLEGALRDIASEEDADPVN